MTEFTLPNAEQFERLIAEFQRLNGGDPSKPIDDLKNAPGPKHLIAGTREAGFYGFVKPNEFGLITGLETPHNIMNGDNLALAIGLSVGTPKDSNIPWMKFSYRGKTIFMPVRPIRYQISWNHIYQAGAVYGSGDIITDGEQFMLENDDFYNGVTKSLERAPQSSVVTLGDRDYVVRLPKGASTDPLNVYENEDRGVVGPDGEWNHLILPLHKDAPNNFSLPQYVGEHTEDWKIDMTDDDLQTDIYGYGMYSFCQETRDSINEGEIGIGRRLARGGDGVTAALAHSSRNIYTNMGWRPVLEIK